jgi:hypothetical protein
MREFMYRCLFTMGVHEMLTLTAEAKTEMSKRFMEKARQTDVIRVFIKGFG